MIILIYSVTEGHPGGGILDLDSDRKRDKYDKKYIKQIRKYLKSNEDSCEMSWDILGELSDDLMEPLPFTGTIDKDFYVYDDS